MACTYQKSDPSKGIVKGVTQSGRHIAKFSCNNAQFAALERAINTARLQDTLECVKPVVDCHCGLRLCAVRSQRDASTA